MITKYSECFNFKKYYSKAHCREFPSACPHLGVAHTKSTVTGCGAWGSCFQILDIVSKGRDRTLREDSRDEMCYTGLPRGSEGHCARGGNGWGVELKVGRWGTGSLRSWGSGASTPGS